MKNEKPILKEDIEHVKVYLSTPQDIKQWVQNVTRSGNAPRYNYSGWSSDLWNKSAVEIQDYLEDRFRETDDVQEYYRCMLYLSTRLDAETLYVLWKDSPNFKALQARQSEQNDQVDTNIAPPKKAVNGIGKVGVKSPQSNVKVMKSRKSWRKM